MGFAADIAGADELAINTFGETVTYKAAGIGAGSSIKGIYDEAFVFIEQMSMGGVQATNPGIMVRGQDVPNVTTEGSTITRGATTYYVRGVEPSGSLTLLRLSKDPTT